MSKTVMRLTSAFIDSLCIIDRCLFCVTDQTLIIHKCNRSLRPGFIQTLIIHKCYGLAHNVGQIDFSLRDHGCIHYIELSASVFQVMKDLKCKYM